MSLAYDPKGRMQQTAASSTEQYLYDGDRLIAEYNTSGTVLRRYVPGRGVDENLVWYEGSGLSTPSWLQTDQQGSTVAVSNGSGAATIYAYSPSGEPYGGWGSSAATPIFRYTGQAALPEIKLYYYKARMYDPVLGRFLQTDPVGYEGEYNLYAYVGNDPVNSTDPTGEYCGPINAGSSYCYRSAAYAVMALDREIAARTNFFSAASVVTSALGWLDAPIAKSFVSSEAREFLSNVSAGLWEQNQTMAQTTKTWALGQFQANDARAVHLEQSYVQNQLNALKTSDPAHSGRIISSLNSALKSDSPFDPQYNRAVGEVRANVWSKEHRSLDFANQNDREAIGRQLNYDLATKNCTATRAYGSC